MGCHLSKSYGLLRPGFNVRNHIRHNIAPCRAVCVWLIGQNSCERIGFLEPAQPLAPQTQGQDPGNCRIPCFEIYANKLAVETF